VWEVLPRLACTGVVDGGDRGSVFGRQLFENALVLPDGKDLGLGKAGMSHLPVAMAVKTVVATVGTPVEIRQGVVSVAGRAVAANASLGWLADKGEEDQSVDEELSLWKARSSVQEDGVVPLHEELLEEPASDGLELAVALANNAIQRADPPLVRNFVEAFVAGSWQPALFDHCRYSA
jgi:hypothetical protein